MSATAPEPALDRDAALSRVGGDEELLKEIAIIFLDDYPKVLAEIRAAVATGDSSQLQVSAHTLKGAVANFGARLIVESLSRLEHIGRTGWTGEGEGAAASQELEILERSLSELRTELDAL